MAVRLALALLALAVLSLLAFPLPPGYDAWIWLDWGRDLAGFELDTDPGSTGVAWKPLPALLAAPLSVAGDAAAPDLWVALVRFCALASLALAYRVGTRLGGRTAGVVAVAAMLLLPDYWGVVARADSEPILVALALGAVELHLGGRRRAALGAIAAAALIRPEVWPFLAAYAGFLWLEDPRARPFAVGSIAIVPLLWFGLDWLGSGEPLTGPGTARAASTRTSTADALGNAAGALAAPVWVLVAVAVAAEFAAGRRIRALAGSPTLVLTSIALAWLAGVVLLGVVGYLGSERFAVAPACLLCPVMGAGAARALQPFEGRWRLAAAAVLVLLVVPLALRQWERTEARFDDLPVAESDALADLIEQSGGRDALVACPGPVRIEDSRLLARLVYELQAPAGQADTMLFVAEPPAGGPQVILARHGGVTEYELDRTAAIGLAEVVALTANDYWSAYAVACERTGNRLPH